MIAAALQQVMTGDAGRMIGLTGHPYLSMYVTSLGDRPGLLIDVDLPEGAAIEDGQGFDIVEVPSAVRNRILVRPTQSGAVSPAFLSLVEYVYRETASARSRAAAISVLVEAVHEFRHFFARRSGRLSESAVRGLFAELELLTELVDVGLTPHDALQAWSGPYRGTDFKFADASAIEVKSTRVPAQAVRISSEHQLDAPSGALHLLVRPLTTAAAESTAGVALLDLVASTQAAVVASPAAKALWDTAIRAIGFDETDPYYRQWRFIPSDWQAYAVVEGFPRIVPSNIADGVSSVSYGLRIESLEGFREDHRTVLEEVAAAYEPSR